MCENCSKECYQLAYINDYYKDNIKSFCYENNDNCEKVIIINDIKYCLCENNPESKELKIKMYEKNK